MNPDAFACIAESLRQYRRADLRDFSKELGDDPVDSLYVDPLPGNAMLRSVMSSIQPFYLDAREPVKVPFSPKPSPSVKDLHAKIAQLAMANDFLAVALGRIPDASAKWG